MMEHSRFITSLLDQSERNLVTSAHKFGDDFETLLNQARDAESMLYGKQPTYPIIGKMNKDSESATGKLREFKKTGLELIKSRQIRNVIDPLSGPCRKRSWAFPFYNQNVGRTTRL
jgi:Domain of unknown function (DUF2935)